MKLFHRNRIVSLCLDVSTAIAKARPTNAFASQDGGEYSAVKVSKALILGAEIQ